MAARSSLCFLGLGGELLILHGLDVLLFPDHSKLSAT